MLTVGALGGGLLGFYVQNMLVETYGVRRPKLDPVLRYAFNSQKPEQQRPSAEADPQKTTFR